MRPLVAIGLAYFGQIPPNLFSLRGEGFPWFLPLAGAWHKSLDWVE